jgi:hypothetical protein
MYWEDPLLKIERVDVILHKEIHARAGEREREKERTHARGRRARERERESEKERERARKRERERERERERDRERVTDFRENDLLRERDGYVDHRMLCCCGGVLINTNFLLSC